VADSDAPVGISVRPISAEALASAIGARTDGAVVTFEGRVRTQNQGRSVLRLHYESYDAMAEEVLGEIVTEARERFGAGKIAVQHRSGSLEIGEVSVAIAAAARHRAAAFDSVRYVIEQIKTRLPIWKREEYNDGTSRWLDGAVPPAPPTGDDPATGAGT
jgi:molybdopterin synthase catalytic subunit